MKTFQLLIMSLLLGLLTACSNGSNNSDKEQKQKKDITTLSIHSGNIVTAPSLDQDSKLKASYTLNKAVIAEAFSDLNKFHIEGALLDNFEIASAKLISSMKSLSTNSDTDRLQSTENSEPVELSTTKGEGLYVLQFTKTVDQLVRSTVISAVLSSHSQADIENRVDLQIELKDVNDNTILFFIPIQNSFAPVSCVASIIYTGQSNEDLTGCKPDRLVNVLIEILKTADGQSFADTMLQLKANFYPENHPQHTAPYDLIPKQRMSAFYETADASYYVLRVGKLQFDRVLGSVENTYGKVKETKYSIEFSQ